MILQNVSHGLLVHVLVLVQVTPQLLVPINNVERNLSNVGRGSHEARGKICGWLSRGTQHVQDPCLLALALALHSGENAWSSSARGAPNTSEVCAGCWFVKDIQGDRGRCHLP